MYAALFDRAQVPTLRLALLRRVLCAVGLATVLISQSRAETATRLAVLGDSDSHSYGDHILLDDVSRRGGLWRQQTMQWTEALVRLRGRQLDLGTWGEWGSRGAVAEVRRWLGLAARAPRKADFENNYAISGAVCSDLMQGRWRQAPALADRIVARPAEWKQAVVVIRIGVNSFGRLDDLQALASGDPGGRVRSKIDECVSFIDRAVSQLRKAQPELRFVLVGIFDNANWPPAFGRWRDPASLDQIARGLDRFDLALKERAAADRRIAFFDDRAWFKAHWGARDVKGEPAYLVPLVAGTTLRVSNAAGDSPDHAVLADGHAGTVWNLWWTQAFVALLRDRFAVPVTPVTDTEIAATVQAALSFAPNGGLTPMPVQGR